MNLEPLNKLNNQAVEVWKLKPWWCQPWTIVLTTIALPSLIWFLFHKIWLTAGLALPLLIWMAFFLGVYPKMVRSLYRMEQQDQQG